MSAPSFLDRRSRDSALIRQISLVEGALKSLAEVASRIARDGGANVDQAMIHAACDDYDRQTHDFKVLLGDMCGFGSEECVDDADDFKSSLSLSYVALVEGLHRPEGYVEAGVLTPSLMAAE